MKNKFFIFEEFYYEYFISYNLALILQILDN